MGTLTHSTRAKAPEQFKDFQSRIHDFCWMLDWKALGKPHCHVYVIGPKEAKPVKVGIAVDGFKRLKGIQTGNWHPLFVHKSAWLQDQKTARSLEFFVHRTLQKHHLSGEWFDVSADEAFETIEWAAESQSLPITQGVPDGMVEAVYEAVKERALAPYFSGSNIEMNVRREEIKALGIDLKSVDDQLTSRNGGKPWADDIPYLEWVKQGASFATK